MAEAESNPMRDKILEIFKHPETRPLNKSELARLMGLSPNARQMMRAELARLEREGLINRGKGNRYTLRKKSKGQLIGTIRMNPGGFAWFYADKNDESNKVSGFDLNEQDRFKVSDRNLSVALDGDRVLVEVLKRSTPPKWVKHSKKHKKRFEERGDQATARVERVVQRSGKGVVGTYCKKAKFHYVEPDDNGMPAVIDLTEVPEGAKHRDKVVVEITQWNDAFAPPQGVVTQVLGPANKPGVDLLAIIHKHGLSEEFPEEVTEETKEYADTISEEEYARREDWRDRLVITIDPYDARDHDDAIWVGRAAEEDGGGWELAVHIADVSHFVKPKSALDLEAQERGNSTYLVDRVLPMLPQKLSNDLCSLRPGVDRLTKCCWIRFDQEARPIKTRFFDAVIHSQAKLSYEHAQQMLDGKAVQAIKELEERLLKGQDAQEVSVAVNIAWDLASRLRKKRFENGSLDLEMPEVKVRLNEEFVPIAIEKQQHGESNQLIEEFMLAANEAVAKRLREAGKPNIYRVHDDPDATKLYEFGEEAKLYGYQPGDLTNRHHIQKLLDASKGKPEEHAIKLGLLKSLKRAEYHPEPWGHYGLAKGDYCHFTSPIRRYADLITHRAIQVFLTNPPYQIDRLPPIGDLEEISLNISKTERNSADAEIESKMLKKLEFLYLGMIKEEPDEFRALVVDVKPNGLFVELPDIVMKGMIKREDFPRGHWEFQQSASRYVGHRNSKLRLSDEFKVKVARVDFERKLVDFVIVEDDE